MTAYKNLSGISGVTHYEVGEDFIKVKFVNSTHVYLYNYIITGQYHVEKMKEYAVMGIGLNTYIVQNKDVRKHFSKFNNNE